jgi:hypothetical protein
MSLAFQLLPKCVVFSLGRKRGDDKKERSGSRILRGIKTENGFCLGISDMGFL